MVAVLQIIVYAGAIVVLFLFVIMLLNLQVRGARPAVPAPLVVVAALGGARAVLARRWPRVRHTPLGAPMPVHAGFGGTEPLAERLFTVYLLPFELTSLLLLVAIVGAVVLGRKQDAS